MAKKRSIEAGTIVSTVLLVASLGLNVFFYQQGRSYYIQLNEVRLDPLGVSTYPLGPRESAGLQQPIVVFYGDSRAANWITSTLPIHLTYINRGVDSQTTAQVLERFRYHVADLKPNVIVLEVGINDLKTIPLFPDQKAGIITNCEVNIQKIVELAGQTGAKVVVTTIFPLGQLPVERALFWSPDVALAISEVNKFIMTLANQKIRVFDATRVLADSRGIVDSRYSKDFLHLNDEGYQALNQELITILSP